MELLARVGMDGKADAYPTQLSGGQPAIHFISGHYQGYSGYRGTSAGVGLYCETVCR